MSVAQPPPSSFALSEEEHTLLLEIIDTVYGEYQADPESDLNCTSSMEWLRKLRKERPGDAPKQHGEHDTPCYAHRHDWLCEMRVRNMYFEPCSAAWCRVCLQPPAVQDFLEFGRISEYNGAHYLENFVENGICIGCARLNAALRR